MAAFGLGLVFTVVTWASVRHWVENQTLSEQRRQVDVLHGQLLERLSLYDQALHAGAAFIQLAEPRSITDWRDFVEQLQVRASLLGVPALAYAPVVRRGDVDAFVTHARNDGLGEFHVWPSPDPDLLVVNRFTAPLDRPNRAALGYDMYQNPVRREAMDAARDSGVTAITAPVTLRIDGASGAADPAFIAYCPVFARALPTDSVQGRRQALRGFTLAPVRIPSLLTQVLGSVGMNAAVRIHDGGGPDLAPAFYATPNPGAVEHWWRREVRFSNRLWTVFYGFPSLPGPSFQNYVPALVLVFGITVTVLLTIVLRNVVTIHAEAVRIAGDMTRALRESEAKFKAVFDNSVQCESLLDGDGRLVSANPAALALVGGTPELVAGLPFWAGDWINREDERARVRDAVRQAATGQPVQLDIVRDHQGGQGGEMWVAVSFKPVLGPEGQVAWIVAEGRDMTEWRRREEALNRVVDALTRSNQELERFAHVAAHDLQEPSRTVVSYAQLLQRRHAGKLDQESEEFLRYLVAGALRMRDLVSDLLAYTQVGSKAEPFVAVDCRQVVDEVLADMRLAAIECGAEIRTGELPVVLGDPGQLALVFRNLLGNAMKFRRPHVAPVITLSAERNGRQWVISVADNGIGIAPEYHERVFDVFQRLHGVDRFPGTGVGLAICRRVIERHGGRIWLASEEGRGAIFRFTLPDGS